MILIVRLINTSSCPWTIGEILDNQRGHRWLLASAVIQGYLTMRYKTVNKYLCELSFTPRVGLESLPKYVRKDLSLDPGGISGVMIIANCRLIGWGEKCYLKYGITYTALNDGEREWLESCILLSLCYSLISSYLWDRHTSIFSFCVSAKYTADCLLSFSKRWDILLKEALNYGTFYIKFWSYLLGFFPLQK